MYTWHNMKEKMNHKINYYSFIWLSIFPMLLLLSFFMAWKLLSTQQFLYAFWYDNTKLENFIDFYAPQNRFKPDFALTNREERIRIFSEILNSINNNGEGLNKISYHNPNNDLLGHVLRAAEIEHLSLVAKLLNFFFKISLWSAFLFFLCFSFLVIKKEKISYFKKIISSYLYILFSIGLIVLMIGPNQVFIFLHEQFFPVGHQWFFFYQESLMTTLMMAPDLFAYFALAWLGLALCIFFPFCFLTIKLHSKIVSRIVHMEI